MNIDHVAFSATRKFDGRGQRALSPAELAQIAGRAGRHMNDGTFGVTSDIHQFDEEVIGRIENHEFEPLRGLYWRNSELRYTSVMALRESLAAPPVIKGLTKPRNADDERVLAKLSENVKVRKLATTPDRIRLLWEVCQIPDFRNVMSDAHASFLAVVYLHLASGEGRLPDDWLAKQLDHLDKFDGDIETLTQRIAGVRIWTYIAYRSDWVVDARYWQERARMIEDTLSDVLHEKLTQRFVDRRTALLVSRIKENEVLIADVKQDGSVFVEDHYVGRLDGFLFTEGSDSNADLDAKMAADETSNNGTAASKAVSSAALRALHQEIQERIQILEKEEDTAFDLVKVDAAWGREILWKEHAIARLVKGAVVLKPEIEVIKSDLLDTKDRDRIQARLNIWLEKWLEGLLLPLNKLEKADLKGPPRGIAFQLGEGLGSLTRSSAIEQIAVCSKEDRWHLRKAGVKIARESVFVPAMLKAAAVSLRGLLWALANDFPFPLPMPPAGRVSIPLDENVPAAFYETIGYRRFGDLGLRVDMIERLAEMAWDLSKKGEFAVTADLLSLAGCGHAEMTAILQGLGFQERLISRVKEPVLESTPVSKPKPEPEPEPEPEPTPDLKQKTDVESETKSGEQPELLPEPVEVVSTEPEQETEKVFEEVLMFRRIPQNHRPKQNTNHNKNKAGVNKGNDRNKPKPSNGQKKPVKHKKYPVKTAPKEVPIDPNSPFAKLAQLKIKSR